MQITPFFFFFCHGCYYSSPSVKRASRTLVGAARFVAPLSHCADARLLLPACSSFICRVCLCVLSLHLQLPPPPNSSAPSRGAVRHLATRCPRNAPAHLGPPVPHSFPVCSHTCISLCHSAFTTRCVFVQRRLTCSTCFNTPLVNHLHVNHRARVAFCNLPPCLC